MRRIDEIIIHCSATMEGRSFTVADIDLWHRQQGYRCIGYHYVITLDGKVYEGRNIDDVGAHCKGHNAHSIGICYIGGLDGQGEPKDTRTPQQKEAMTSLLYCLIGQFPDATIHGHNEFSDKACPCFDVSEYLKEIGLDPI